MIDKLIKLCELKDDLECEIDYEGKIDFAETEYNPCDIWRFNGDSLFTYNESGFMNLYEDTKIISTSKEYTVFRVQPRGIDYLIILSVSKEITEMTIKSGETY
jgi:hypothetical protein